MTIRKFLVMLLAVCTTVATVGVASAVGQRSAPSASVPLDSSDLQALSSDMSVLKTGTEPLRDVSGSPVVATDIIDLGDARQLVAHPESYVAPTTDGFGVCIAGPGRMACADAETLMARGASPAYVWDAAGNVHLFGFTTDDVDSVTVVYADGSEQTVGAEDNVLDADLKERPAAIRWRGPSGAEALTARTA